ncbi:efflux RND transporter permease subunit [Pleurocapsales cyanobacterium LEGE 06147]|nr:efflux RND transporter permease subunit [Pleurocapsales cyanobacterium LEGE 06147]
MSNLLYRNIRLLILTICLILVWGLSSYQVLPRMEDPEISRRFATITTHFPGASVYRVESLVTQKIEQELFEIEQLKTISSISRSGSSTVFVELKDETADKDRVWSEVRDKLSDVTPQLPQGVLEPEYRDLEASAYGLICALIWDLESPTNYAILNRLAQELEDELRILSGTEKIELFGAPSEEIVVEINPGKLAVLGLTPQELAQQIQMSDAKIAAGQLRSTSNNLLIEPQTELDSLARIRQIPIRFGQSGEFANLGDIALVKKGIREPPDELALVDGRASVALAVLIEPNQRIDQWTETARHSLETFRQQLPDGIELQEIFNQSRYVENRINGLFKNLLLGALCVVGTTLFLMGWKSALVVGSALPLSALLVFGGMRMLGISLHQMSVTGLVIALGMLIDNAVVIVDEVEDRLRRGLEPKKAISTSVNYLAIPLLASTLTTVLTFMPIALMSGEIGEFVSSIGLSVILALFSSLFLSLTIIPALAARIHRIPTEEKGNEKGKKNLSTPNQGWRIWWNKGFFSPGLTRIYRRTLDKILGRPRLGILLALVLPALGFLMAPSLQEQFFPPAERDQFYIDFQLPSSTSLQQTRSMVLQAREIILNYPQVVNVHWFVGTTVPAFYYNLPRHTGASTNSAHGLVQLTSAKRSRALIQTLQKELDRTFPSARVVVKQLEQGPPVNAPIELRIYGSNLDLLRELGNQARLKLAGVSNVTHTSASLTDSLPKLALHLDEEQAQLAGLDHTAIARQLDANLEGTLGGSVLEDTEELPVRVRLSNSRRSELDAITSLELLPNAVSEEGKNRPLIPLSALGKIDLIPEPATIDRRNGKRVNTVKGFITAGVLPSEVLAEFKQSLSATDFQLPAGYSFEFAGESEERNQAMDNLMSTAGVLLMLMVATLVLSFNSFSSAGIIGLVGISSIGLGLASLWWFGYPLGFMAILGTVGLIGVAINDSIVVLAALRSNPAARQGDRKAIREVLVRSTRHVLTTTITTIAGFVPLLLDGGEFWSPLAICIASGVGGATFLALTLVPCVYLLLIDRSRRKTTRLANSDRS